MKLVLLAFLLGIVVFQADASACPKGVEVWVINGHGMTGDGLSNPDPYVVVKFGSESKRSKVFRSIRNPIWWERLKFHHITSDEIITEVWDKDGGHRGADDKIGTCKHLIIPARLVFHRFECKTNGKGYVKFAYMCR